MPKTKILFLIPTLFQGGGERVVSELSLHLPEDIETFIVLFEKKVSYPYKGKLFDLGTSVSSNFFLRIYYFFLRLVRCKEILKKENPAYVISVGNSANIINILLSKNSVVRVDLPVSKSNRGFWGFVFKLFVKIFFSKAKHIIAVSNVAKKDLVDNFGIKDEKIQVIYNPIDTEKIQRLSQIPLEKKYKNIFTRPVIITIGRLTHQKGQWQIIKALKRIKENVPDFQLIILGEGELKGSLQKLAKKMGIENDVHFLGWQKNPFSFLSQSKLFVLPSLWEGLPDVLLEAMACGLPVISSDCVSGPREILSPLSDIQKKAKDIEFGQYGILVPVGDDYFSQNSELSEKEEMLAEAVVRVQKDDSLAKDMQKQSKQRAEDFSITRIIQDWNFLK